MDGCCQVCQFLFCANVLFPIICKRKVSQSDGRREPMISAMRGVQCQDLDWLELDWQLEYNKRKPIATLELTWINHKLRVLFRAQSGFFLTIILSLKRGLCGEVFFYLGLGWPPALKQHAITCIVLLLQVKAYICMAHPYLYSWHCEHSLILFIHWYYNVLFYWS